MEISNRALELAATGRYGAPEQILTDNGDVFTGRFGPGAGQVAGHTVTPVVHSAGNHTAWQRGGSDASSDRRASRRRAAGDIRRPSSSPVPVTVTPSPRS